MFANVQKSQLMGLVIVLLLMLSVDFVRPSPNKSAPKKPSDLLNLIILHSNDMHSRFLPVDNSDPSLNSFRSTDPNITKGYGGFARHAHVIKEYRRAAKNASATPVLYFNGGDNYIGSRWFNLFKDKVVTDFVNVLNPDAMCLGNHEWDLDQKVLTPFLKNAKYPILFANYKPKHENCTLKQIESVMPSIVFIIRNHRIGVIGYLTTDIGKVKLDFNITDEVSAVKTEAKKLRANGVKTIIALGHSGYDMDQKIARKCKDVDLVIGAHTHTMLFNKEHGEAPDDREDKDTIIKGKYPTEIKNEKSGRLVPVVTAFWATKYLGKLEIQINTTSGKIRSWTGNPILLDPKTPQDEETKILEEKYRKLESERAGPLLGVSTLHFSDWRCKVLECGLGNMITDGFVLAAKAHLGDRSFKSSVGLIATSAIRGQLPVGDITRLELEEVVPINGNLTIIKITGAKLLEALEYSVMTYEQSRFSGKFLQVSGLRVHFDLKKGLAHYVKSVEILNSKSSYEKLDLKKEYNVIITDYMYTKDPFNDCKEHILPVTIVDAFEMYIKEVRTINHNQHDGRIKLENEPPLKPHHPPLYSFN